MNTLQYNKISLRALESSDLEFLFNIENNEKYWVLSNTLLPYSKELLKNYIENAKTDIYEAKQFRFVITNENNVAVGLIDLFDFEPHHKRAGIGIIILDKYQQKGYGFDALHALINYSFTHLQLHQLYANIMASNKKSIQLFEKLKFKKIGTKKDWVFSNDNYSDELLYQLINK